VDRADGGGVPVACAAVGLDELPSMRLLARDLARIHPEWPLTVLVLDGDPLAGEPFETIGVGALDLAEPGLMEILTKGPRGLAAALRPSLMAWLAERSGGPVVWLEATVRLYGPLDALAGAARDGVAVAPLHPRIERPRGLAARGAFESGVVAVGDSTALRWWERLLIDMARRGGARYDPSSGDALSALVGAAERSYVLRAPGLCAGWWTVAAGGRIDGDPPTLDGDPLRALNLAGFDPTRSHWLTSEDTTGRARVSDSPALVSLLADHASDLLAAGWRSPDEGRWRYRRLHSGLVVDDDLRDLFALASGEGIALGDPFTAAGCAAFLDWIDSEASLGGGVTWYLERVHRRRPDLQRTFPDLAGGDGRGLAAWMGEYGAAEEPVLAALVERRADRAAGPVEAPAAAAPGLPPVRVVGYLGDGIGLGEAARSYVGALSAAGMAVETVSVPVPLNHGVGTDGRVLRRRRVEWNGPVGSASAPVELVCMNPPELLRLERAGMPRRKGVRRIGFWAWELDAIPTGWSQAYAAVDEVWVCSEYVAAALGDAPVPVGVVPIAVDVDRLAAAAANRTRTDGPFTFLFMFDLFSTLERKNPLGLIEAFRSAFDPGEGARLLLKVTNGDNRPEELERLRVAALGRPDIEIVDAFLSVDERDALIAGCDCYVSLHRAEGFGLTLAEAMAAGRPTIATGFSGNLDFMTAETSHLVGARTALVEAGSDIYTPGARWSEPDINDAVRSMRSVHADPAAASERAAAGCEHVRRLLAPAAVGACARERIERMIPPPARRSRRIALRRPQRADA
jgi:glycosyltransferase involved in cell wall biosynthesis